MILSDYFFICEFHPVFVWNSNNVSQ